MWSRDRIFFPLLVGTPLPHNFLWKWNYTVGFARPPTTYRETETLFEAPPLSLAYTLFVANVGVVGRSFAADCSLLTACRTRPHTGRVGRKYNTKQHFEPLVGARASMDGPLVFLSVLGLTSLAWWTWRSN